MNLEVKELAEKLVKAINETDTELDAIEIVEEILEKEL